LNRERKKEILEPPYREYTEKLMASVPETGPGWLVKILNEHVSVFINQ